MECPQCWHSDSVVIDYTPEFNPGKPYEVVCYNCAWFSRRFKTKEQAKQSLRKPVNPQHEGEK